MSRRAIPVCGAPLAHEQFTRWLGNHAARKYAAFKAAANDETVRQLQDEIARAEWRRWRQVQQEAGK